MESKRVWEIGAAALLIAALALSAGLAVAQHNREQAWLRLQTPLCIAAERGDADRLKTLLAHSSYPGHLGSHGKWALYAALNTNQIATVRVLLEAGADPNVPAPNTPHPFFTALTRSPALPQMFRLLLEAGADPNARDPQLAQTSLGTLTSRSCNQSILMRAVIEGKYSIARLLLAHGAVVDAQDSEGRSTIHWWVLCGRDEPECLELGRLLVKNTNSINVLDRYGKSALSYGFSQPDDPKSVILIGAGATK